MGTEPLKETSSQQSEEERERHCPQNPRLLVSRRYMKTPSTEPQTPGLKALHEDPVHRTPDSWSQGVTRHRPQTPRLLVSRRYMKTPSTEPPDSWSQGVT
ncbi:hypothetical protein NHX12_016319 [Muraenolepis orangiensis]|uniref:Uncharacterized protein n=1 Tax=Muraenolepis orangiensis TaxID=630683 RepID=A0A9Q0D7Y9_9TELE|nr:hypothetical protein NHX12_016319 [Muraenolepis orangiensis]